MNWLQQCEDVSGDTLALSVDGRILANGDDDSEGNGWNSGTAQVYQYDEVAGAWSKLGNALFLGEQRDKFGCSASLSGDGTTLAVEGQQQFVPGDASGFACIYSFGNDSWVQKGLDLDLTMALAWVSSYLEMERSWPRQQHNLILKTT